MSEYTIKVYIETRRGESLATAWAPLEDAMEIVFTPLKISDGALPIFDTPAAVVKRVKQTRAGYAKYLAPRIERLLLDAMESRDMFNGYTKDELKKMMEPT
jgi:hypothetical protein